MITYLAASEILSVRPSKGDLLVFHHRHDMNSKSASRSDEESGSTNIISKDDDESHISIGPGNREVKIQSHQAIFHWRDVCYDIKIQGRPRRILDHVDGWVKPGTLTVLMVCLDTGFG